jgi:hypothetical protein
VRSPLALVFALSILPLACDKEGAPEKVADQFVDAYFRRVDQEKAKEYTALGATEMLEKELKDVAQLRKDGYGPHEAQGGQLEVRRKESQQRDQRVRVPYEIVLKSEGGESVRDADVELANIHGQWKVVRVGLKQR